MGPPQQQHEGLIEKCFRERLQHIQKQRDDASQSMGDRLLALVAQYKKEEQALVDSYSVCLNQFRTIHPGLAATCEWAKPCPSVPEMEFWEQDGLTIRYEPLRIDSPPRRQQPPKRDGVAKEAPVAKEPPDTGPPSPATLPSKIPSNVSNQGRRSQAHGLALKSSPPTPSLTRSALDPQSPDVLGPCPPRPQKRKRSAETPAPSSPPKQPSASICGKMVVFNLGSERAASLGADKVPSPVQKTKGPTRRTYVRAKCAECRMLQRNCSRGLPCEECKEDGGGEQCRYGTARQMADEARRKRDEIPASQD
ncbi:hypothetical protein QBC47DRAFT_443159 [Echria macrotheca]|uniref:Zn(2)-C6 fungal-type domain-containing protein n=1 Tax=Echria macrotheca TaxID=438768 RepID=A0AAJ0F7C7_9PEZI|nr:hypothetical protein QBC47DRAFT_443159 [Echria macrotheca]